MVDMSALKLRGAASSLKVAPVGRVVIAEERLRVAVEHEAQDSRRLEERQTFREELARRLVGRHDDEQAVDESGNQPRIEHRQHRRRIDQDEVVLLSRLLKELLESWRSKNVVDGHARRTREDHGEIETVDLLGDVL